MKIPQKPPDQKKIRKVLEENPQYLSLIDENITRVVNECVRRHLHWDELRYRDLPNNIKPEFIWMILKLFRNQRYNKFKFGNIEFKYLLWDDTIEQLHILDKYAAGNIETDFGSINTEGKEKYIINSLMEEAIASSQLEGAATTRKIAKEILRKKKKPLNYSEQMIVNGYNTIQKIVRMKEKKITPEMILNLQRDITKNTLKNKEDEGNFRDNNEVVIADSRDDKVLYKPPDCREIPDLMDEFCKFASDETDYGLGFIHPIIKGIILHFLIGYLHPFNDGNGRTARAIFYWYVLTQGYWLFEFMPISRILLRSKVKYALSYLYTETDENDLTYFIKYNLSAIDEALHEMEEYIKRKQKEHSEAANLIESIEDINPRQADILKRFMKNQDKYFVINEIMNTYGVVYETARSDLLHLTELGYLEKKLVKNKFMFRLLKKELAEK